MTLHKILRRHWGVQGSEPTPSPPEGMSSTLPFQSILEFWLLSSESHPEVNRGGHLFRDTWGEPCCP